MEELITPKSFFIALALGSCLVALCFWASSDVLQGFFTGANKASSNWQPPKVGEQYTFNPDSQLPTSGEILDVSGPDKDMDWLIRTRHTRDGTTMTHRIRRDGTVAYWNVRDE